jgi:hypothetical protein
VIDFDHLYAYYIVHTFYAERQFAQPTRGRELSLFTHKRPTLISLQQSQTLRYSSAGDSAGVGVNKRSSRFYLPSIKHWRALNCASPLELFTSSLGPPDNHSERLLATLLTGSRSSGGAIGRIDPGAPGIFSALPIVIVVVVAVVVVVVVFLLIALIACTSTFKGRDESPPRRLPSEPCLQRDSHTFAFPGPPHSRARGYPRHTSWKKPPGTGAGFIYSSRRDFHVNLPRTFVTIPIMDW